ncbi:hypothetical protein C1645_830845 [Glomus cerebriforme]|uniref:Uncharacterized protein n=1 Tax=Glomus cerebriforme TaxID=658196 RepID=A0A397SHB1_9GLOM|nr:hypothetical protein C1645_830845 [Glomus cerebriforme]
MSELHFNNIKNGKTWYPYYANKASHIIEDAKPCTLEDIKQLAYNRKRACLSEYYINNQLALL